MAVWQSGDTQRLDSLLADSVVYDYYPDGTQYMGRDQVTGYIRHVHAWAGQVSLEVTAVHGASQSAVAEWIMRGVQDRPIQGRVPIATHRPFTLRGATIVELAPGGRIARAADYIDVLGFVLQLGARVELPGGVTVQTVP